MKFARPRHTHGLILFPIEVSGRRVHRDDEFGVRGKGKLQEIVVWFVPDDPELGSRIADGKLSTISATNSSWSPRTSTYSSRMAGG